MTREEGSLGEGSPSRRPSSFSPFPFPLAHHDRHPLEIHVVAVALVLGFVIPCPISSGESPAVTGVQRQGDPEDRRQDPLPGPRELKGGGHASTTAFNSISMGSRPLRDTTDTQLKAKDALEKTFNPDTADPHYVIA